MSDLVYIEEFIQEHHVMSLATANEDELSVCSLFYVYDKNTKSFIVASSDETLHIQHITKNKQIAGNILLETKKVGEIKGLQFQGEFLSLKNKALQELYFKEFPYAIELNPRLWQIKVKTFKLTDNSLGFAKKIIVKL